MAHCKWGVVCVVYVYTHNTHTYMYICTFFFKILELGYISDYATCCTRNWGGGLVVLLGARDFFFLFLPVSILALEIICLPWQSSDYCGESFSGLKMAIFPSSAEVNVWICDSTS